MTSSRPRIYLASQSPRRRELLRQIDVRFDLLLFRTGERADLDVDETPLHGEDVETYAARLARMKARAGVRRLQQRKLVIRPVLGADTTLEVDGEIVGKPTSPSDACATLARLSGRTHRVLTAVALADETDEECLISISEVRFRKLSESEIRHYVDTGEPMDKAGAYGIQGRAAIFVEDIRGSHSGIMGLPLFETAQLLARFGLPVLG
jgi:septum formation protein